MTFKLHKSHLKSFRFCPRRFEAVWIQKTIVVERSPAMTAGGSFHGFAFDFFDMIDLNDLKRLSARQEIETYFSSFIPHSFEPPLSTYCINFTKFEADHYLYLKRSGQLDFFTPLERELRIDLDFAGGILDRVDLVNGGYISVGEYKTEKRFNKTELRRETGFYAILLNATDRFKNRTTHLFVYNSNLHKWMIEKLHRNTLRAVFRDIQKLKACMDSGIFPPRFTSYCFRCPKFQECIEEYPRKWEEWEKGIPKKEEISLDEFKQLGKA